VQAGGGKFLAEEGHIGIRNRLSLPLVGIAGKDLQHAAVGGNGPVNGQVQAAGDGHMGAKIIVHGCSNSM
jgi:hypothetical protein